MRVAENVRTAGIGGAVARRFAKEAFTVALMSRSEGSIQPVYDAIVAVRVPAQLPCTPPLIRPHRQVAQPSKCLALMLPAPSQWPTHLPSSRRPPSSLWMS